MVLSRFWNLCAEHCIIFIPPAANRTNELTGFLDGKFLEGECKVEVSRQADPVAPLADSFLHPLPRLKIKTAPRIRMAKNLIKDPKLEGTGKR